MTKPILLELEPDEYLRIMRSRLELTQAQLAKRLGIERRSVMRYETGICRIPPERLEAIRQMAEQETI